MKSKVVRMFLFCCMAVLLVGCSGNSNKKTEDKSVTKKILYVTDDKKETADAKFEQKIKQDGKTYVLENISYQELEKVPKEKTVTKKIESETYPEGQAWRPDQEIVEDGITYKLSQVTEEKSVYKEAWSQPVTGYTDYSKPVTKADVPGTKQITVENAETGQMETVTCSISGIVQLPGEWENTYIDITYETYDADRFVWGNSVVGKNEATPEIDKTQLLASVGADDGTYRVGNVYWTGQPYTDPSGILCRDARADVQRLTAYHRVNYTGEIPHPEVPGIRYTAVYEGKRKDASAGYQYQMQATASYRPVFPAAVILAGVGIAIIILALIGILFLIARRKKEKEEKTR